tara:strand:+ start:6257 stop:6367 length:111 start_codon:yes stop_codon:yes gene_type:complete
MKVKFYKKKEFKPAKQINFSALCEKQGFLLKKRLFF